MWVSGPLLRASGFPLTAIGRWVWNYPPGVSPAVRRFWVYVRWMLRHRQRPNFEPWPGWMQVPAQASAALDNKVQTPDAGKAIPNDLVHHQALSRMNALNVTSLDPRGLLLSVHSFPLSQTKPSGSLQMPSGSLQKPFA